MPHVSHLHQWDSVLLACRLLGPGSPLAPRLGGVGREVLCDEPPGSPRPSPPFTDEEAEAQHGCATQLAGSLQGQMACFPLAVAHF